MCRWVIVVFGVLALVSQCCGARYDQVLLRPLVSAPRADVCGVRAHLATGEIRLIQADGKQALREYQAALDAKPADAADR